MKQSFKGTKEIHMGEKKKKKTSRCHWFNNIEKNTLLLYIKNSIHLHKQITRLSCLSCAASNALQDVPLHPASVAHKLNSIRSFNSRLEETQMFAKKPIVVAICLPTRFPNLAWTNVPAWHQMSLLLTVQLKWSIAYQILGIFDQNAVNWHLK